MTPPPAPYEQKKRRWYHWLLDIALFAMAAYLIKTRFIDKKEHMVTPPEPGTSTTSAELDGFDGGTRVVVKPAPVLQGPGYTFAPIASLSVPTRAYLLEPPDAGWAKIKLGKSDEGWVRAEAVSDPNALRPIVTDGGTRR